MTATEPVLEDVEAETGLRDGVEGIIAVVDGNGLVLDLALAVLVLLVGAADVSEGLAEVGHPVETEREELPAEVGLDDSTLASQDVLLIVEHRAALDGLEAQPEEEEGEEVVNLVDGDPCNKPATQELDSKRLEGVFVERQGSDSLVLLGLRAEELLEATARGEETETRSAARAKSGWMSPPGSGCR